MQVIRNPADVTDIADPELRHLIEKTIRDLSPDGPYDPNVLGYFVIVEQGDSLDAIKTQIGFGLLVNRWTGIRYDEPGYTQSWECLDEHAGYWEIVFVTDDSGYGIEVFVPKTTDIPDLFAMCQRYSTPAPLPAHSDLRNAGDLI